ncbi:MAG TPA: DUF3703 domain-containing protein [Burkholderiaceae bacterium]|nr:DUF3703 domain-containing protein [Burkholderiaceae bacterium]
MTRYTRRIRPHVLAELAAAQVAPTAQVAFRHLERAHVLSQGSTVLHVQVHWHMLRWSLAQRDGRELRGQLLRLVGAATKTAMGWVPRGNTGGSNVPAWRPLPVDAALQRLIDSARGPAR